MKNPFLKKDFYKDVGTLIGGTGISQLIPIAVSPILTRIYTPEDFGVLAFFMAFTSILGVVATGRYEMAILMPKTDNNAKNLGALSFFIATIISLATLIIFLLYGHQILTFLNFGIYTYLIFLIPIGIFAKSIFQIFTYTLNRVKHYKAIAGSKITRSIGGSGIQLGLGFLSFSSLGLVLGKLIGEILGCLYGFWITIRHKQYKNEKINWTKIQKLSKDYKEFPKYNAPHAFTNTASSNLPNILLASLFSSSIAGFYSLSHRVCFAPIQLISTSVQQVYSRSVTERFNEGKDIFEYSKSVFKQLSLLAIIPFTALLIFAPSLFEFIFGEEWRIAGVYSQFLTPFLYLVFVVSPITYLPLLLNKQRKAFAIDVVYLILRVSALGLGFLLGDALLAIILFSAVGVIIQLYLLYWILSIAKQAS
ncbi:MAG: hypothetical protein CL666_11540 [Balneola sp.]|nr:hypothetical protein [Balneola sp.]|tara:strand:- start:33195 stop:34457 length:1263 start_codon:yes stop_codon:yes gene_type:complete